MDVGFVGVGLMGHGMARNLLRHGHALTVIAHRNRGPIDDLVSHGAIEAAGLTDLAVACDVVVICVTGTVVAREVVAGLVPHLRPGALVIDTTTHEPDGPEALAATLAAVGVGYVEAPLTGGAVQAQEGILGAIVGGAPDDVARAKPVLSCFCKRIAHFGSIGMGVRAKLVSNLLALGTATLVIETFRQARALGVDWQKLYDLALLGSGKSTGLERIVGGALEGNDKRYVFSVHNALKDFECIAQLETMLDGNDLVDALLAYHATAVTDGHGDRMLSELLVVQRDRSVE